MKANELMIGDWVVLNMSILPVAAIHEDKIGFLDSEEEIYWAYEDYDVVNPIPLTKDILVKNGFNIDKGYAVLQLNEDTYLDFYLHENRLRRVWEGIDEWNNHAKIKDVSFVCNCRYVHELQHAFRLCGIEKEIEL